jgi:hypothetical protein
MLLLTWRHLYLEALCPKWTCSPSTTIKLSDSRTVNLLSLRILPGFWQQTNSNTAV